MNIGEMMQLEAFQNSKVLAGYNGIHNNVLNATIIDAPDGYQWCKSGDFIATTGYPFIRNQKWQDGLMHLLNVLVNKNCSGVGLKLGRYIPIIPKEIISFANKNNLPIISIPNNLSWTDVIVPIITQINEQHKHELEMTYKVYEQFHNHLKIKGNLHDLAKLLSSIMEATVTIYIRDSNKILNTHEVLFPKDEIESIISTLFSIENETIQQINWHNNVFTVRWIYSSDRLAGGVFLWGVDTVLQAWEKAALEQTAVITALEIERIKSVSTTFQHFRNDFLAVLLDGSNLDREVLYRRAKEVNWNLEDSYKVVLLDCNLEGLPENIEIPLWQKKVTILEDFKNELRWILPKTLIGFDSQNRFVLLVPKMEDDELLIEKLENITIKLNVTSFFGGIGSLNTVENLSMSHNEAITALQVSRSSISNSTNNRSKNKLYIRSFNNLDVERIIYSENPKAEAENLAKYYFQELMNYDKERESDLLITLKTFLNCNMNYDDTANALFIHKNTVRYRLGIIRDLTNLDPGNLKDQLLLQIALVAIDTL